MIDGVGAAHYHKTNNNNYKHRKSAIEMIEPSLLERMWQWLDINWSETIRVCVVRERSNKTRHNIQLHWDLAIMTNDINFNAKSKTNPSIMEPVDETPSLTLKVGLSVCECVVRCAWVERVFCLCVLVSSSIYFFLSTKFAHRNSISIGDY